ncbi:MAG: bifunctional folylpolyglutamate synthase/dihydrofolate synthase [Nitrospirae bacterium]|nr:bifunctional folylpolyglutamate synthase/dihydrofolate synthase [Nitrospirota bacterium]MBF0540642.1 bifunctional folylpolyglutamate synthase/dihydrofolate synthase [Nitrospirota bacterium]
MDYNNTLSYLYNLRSHGIKLGLENINKISQLLGLPQSAYNTVHIAGTNGKGTTAKTFQALLTTQGFKTGIFTSPHLTRFTERIVIDDVEIKEVEVINLTMQIRERLKTIPDITPTFFECATLIAFLFFKKMGVQWGVFETGLGGRFDSTNIIKPALCIITNINVDHKEFLGETIEEIAFEKAGIIKPNVPVISMLQSDKAMAVIEERARTNSAPLYVYGKDFRAEDIVTDIRGSVFKYIGRQSVSLHTPISGIHQVQNIACAIKGFELLFGDLSMVQSAIGDLKWQARYELVEYNGRSILIDGAHNPAAIAALAQTIKDIYLTNNNYKEVILIIGIMSDKDKTKMLENILPICSHVIFTAPANGRAENPQNLADIAESISLKNKPQFYLSADTLDALNQASKLSSEKSLIVITGSFYVIGEIKEIMGEKVLLKDLAEVFRQTR